MFFNAGLNFSLIYISARARLCFHVSATAVIVGVVVCVCVCDSPHKDRGRGVCLLTGRCTRFSAALISACSFCTNVRLLMLVFVLLLTRWSGGGGRLSPLTAACSETARERDSASLTETDRTRLVKRRFSCRASRRGHAEDV